MRPPRHPAYRVWLFEKDDAIDVQTNASDWAQVTGDPNSPRPLEMMFQVVFYALRRTGYDIPSNFRVFLDKSLDGNPEEIKPGEPDLMDPTERDQ